MMQVTFHTMADGFIFVLQLALAFIGWKIKAEISELRSHMYENFLTKKDFHQLWNRKS
jgi:hypothetical protein